MTTKSHRFYARPIIQPLTELDPDQARHAASVMRLKPGDPVELFDGLGTLARGRLAEIQKKSVTVEILDLQCHTPPANAKIIIASSIAKGERFDDLIVKCTELGVDRIVPILFDRTVKLAAGKPNQRLQNLALAACKQSGRLFLPDIDPPTNLNTALKNLNNLYPNAQIIFGSFSGKTWSQTPLDPQRDTIAFIGPEGGMTPDEESLLITHHANPIRLTETTLRVETAAITFAALLTINRFNSFSLENNL